MPGSARRAAHLLPDDVGLGFIRVHESIDACLNHARSLLWCGLTASCTPTPFYLSKIRCKAHTVILSDQMAHHGTCPIAGCHRFFQGGQPLVNVLEPDRDRPLMKTVQLTPGV
jgi:hypothetical protein